VKVGGALVYRYTGRPPYHKTLELLTREAGYRLELAGNGYLYVRHPSGDGIVEAYPPNAIGALYALGPGPWGA
jgi:hypothetical protein